MSYNLNADKSMTGIKAGAIGNTVPCLTGAQASRLPILRQRAMTRRLASGTLALQSLLALVALFSLTAFAQSDRNNPLPISRPEIRDNIVPGMNNYYAFMAGPGDLNLNLEVKSNGDYSLVIVNVFNQSGQSLVDFNRSSTDDKRERKVILTSQQPIILQVSSPKVSQGGIFVLKISGAFKGATTLALGNRKADGNSPSGNTQPPDITQSKTLNEHQVVKNDQPVSYSSSASSVASAVSEINGEKRVALLIGNSAYKTSPLRNPVNDSRDMANALRACGFEVTQLENVTRREMEEQIRAFGKKLSRETVALFYYSGHGLQVKGENYLVPVDARIEKETDVEYEGVNVGRVMGELDTAGSRLNIIILDACRDNPFARVSRSTQRGLAVVSAPTGSVIVYSTAPGMVADDGDGRNGRYTEEFLKTVRQPGLKIEDVLKRTRIAVREKSKGNQIPWETSSIDGDFYFVRPSVQK